MRLLWQDCLIVAALVFQWSCLLMTRYVLFSMPVAVEVAKQNEANPVMRRIIDNGFQSAIFNVISEGSIIACYIWIRRKFLHGDGSAEVIMLVAVFVLFVVQADAFFNDFGIFLKLIVTEVWP